MPKSRSGEKASKKPDHPGRLQRSRNGCQVFYVIAICLAANFLFNVLTSAALQIEAPQITSQPAFDCNQPWCRTNQPLIFVSENREIISLYEGGSDDGLAKNSGPASSSDQGGEDNPLPSSSDSLGQSQPRRSLQRQSNAKSIATTLAAPSIQSTFLDIPPSPSEASRNYGPAPAVVEASFSWSLSTGSDICHESDVIDIVDVSTPQNTGSLGIDFTADSGDSLSLTQPQQTTSVQTGNAWFDEAHGVNVRNKTSSFRLSSSILSPLLASDLHLDDLTLSEGEQPESAAASALAALRWQGAKHDSDCGDPLSPEAVGDAQGTVDLTPPVSIHQRPASGWPLRNDMEAFLFRYYIDYASRAFDLCDLLRHFALVVPCRALSYAPLLNAIFAVSARQLSRTNADMDPAVADVYYQECLTGLRHMMVDESALMDENLFAATVILRNLEEIDSPMQGDGSGSQNAHLLGNSLFAKATVALHSLARLSDGAGGSPMFTGLRRAAYLVAVREEIYTSFVAQRPISPSFSSLVIDMSLDAQPDDDPDWANRAVFLLADALQFCFGGENDDGGVIGNSRNNIGASDARNGNDTVPASSVYARYDELVDYARRWHQKKPQSFSPLYYYDPLAETSAAGSPLGKKTGMDWAVGLRRKNYTRNPDGFFPEIWLMSDAVCTGMMHYHLARILLLAFDPRAPRVGPKRAPFSEEQGRLIRQEVRVLVGIALSNGDDCYPNYVSACMGIALVGERFESRIERDKILGFLEHTESVCPWTAVTAKEHMSEAWEIGRRSQSRAQCG